MSVTAESAGPLVGLAEELKRQLETKRDLIADTRRVSLATIEGDEDGITKNALLLDVDMPDGAEAFSLTPHAHRQLAGHLGIPWKMYDRLLHGTQPENGKRKPAHPDLLAQLANGLLSREPSRQMIRTMDGKARAFLSDRYRPRDNWDLLDGAVLPVLDEFPSRVEFKQATLTDTRMYVKLFLPDVVVQVTPKVGDVMRVGAIISNSEVGAGSLYVYPYSDILSCLNGMVHTQYGQRRVHLGGRIGGDGDSIDAYEFYSDMTLKLDDEAFFAKVKDTLRSVLNQTVFEAIAADMRDLAGVRVNDAPAAVEVLAKQHGFSEKESNSMLTNLITGGDTSAYGLVNAITATARDMEDADRQTELETLAGNLVSEREWAPKLLVAA